MCIRDSPSSPEIKKRSESTISGEAAVTRILAEVNALDQIIEKLTPIIMERKSIAKSFALYLNIVGWINNGSQGIPQLTSIYLSDSIKLESGLKK